MVARAIDALKILSNEGFKFIVISNQAGIARKMVSEDEVKSINVKMQSELMKESIEILETYFCLTTGMMGVSAGNQNQAYSLKHHQNTYLELRKHCLLEMIAETVKLRIIQVVSQSLSVIKMNSKI